MLSDKEIEEKVEKYTRIFSSENKARDIVLNAHLLVEQIVSEMIDSATIDLSFNPFKSDRSNFSTNVKVALCMGLIDEDQYKRINSLNTARNHYSHNIDYIITKREIRNICPSNKNKGEDMEESLLISITNLLGNLDTSAAFLKRSPFSVILRNKKVFFESDKDFDKVDLKEYLQVKVKELGNDVTK